jgi:choline-sulfatase
MMSCTGNEWVHTPAMDGLALGGLRFERAYCTNPVCVPSRFSLQTGLMPSAIGMVYNRDGTPVPDPILETALGRLLQQAGYHTAYAGKTHLPGELERNTRTRDYEFLAADERDGCADACVKFLGRTHAKPFFLTASFINPHDVCHMAINAFERAGGEQGFKNIDAATCEMVLDGARSHGDLEAFVREHAPPLPDNFEPPELEPEAITTSYVRARMFRDHVRQNWGETEWRLHRWLYCRLTERVDRQIARVLDALDANGLSDDTLVVFTSDHGDHDAAHRLEHKSVLYDEATRVPLVMRLPGCIPAGLADTEHLVSNGLDLLPTLCDYAGAKTPSGRPGASLRPLAAGDTTVPWRESVFVESQHGCMVRTATHAYSVYDSGARPEALYDHTVDPGETENAAYRESHRWVRQRYRELMLEWIDRAGNASTTTYAKPAELASRR